MLVLWGKKAKIEAWYDALAVWRPYCAAQVSGGSVNSGHYLAEEAPGEVLQNLTGFLSG
jgi:haloacetate dehalogenase